MTKTIETITEPAMAAGMKSEEECPETLRSKC